MKNTLPVALLLFSLSHEAYPCLLGRVITRLLSRTTPVGTELPAPPFTLEIESLPDGPPPAPTFRELKLKGIKKDPNIPTAYRYYVSRDRMLKPQTMYDIEDRYLIWMEMASPGSLTKFGVEFERDKDGRIVAYSYLDVRGLNHLIQELQKAQDPDAPSVLFVPDLGKTDTPHLKLGRLWARRYVIWSVNGFDDEGLGLHSHDFHFHGPGYLLFPRLAVEISARQMEALFAFYDSPLCQRNEDVRTLIEKLIARKVKAIDGASATLSAELFSQIARESPRNVSRPLFQICDFGYLGGSYVFTKDPDRPYLGKGYAKEEGRSIRELFKNLQLRDQLPPKERKPYDELMKALGALHDLDLGSRKEEQDALLAEAKLLESRFPLSPPKK